MTDIKRKININFITIPIFILLILMGFFLPEGVKSLVIHIMVLSIFAMAYDICLGFTNQCSLGHSIFFGVGAYGVALSIIHFQTGLLSSFFICIILGIILGLIAGIICVKLSEAYFVIVTAVFYAIFHLSAMNMTWLTGGDDGLAIHLPKISLRFVEISLYDKIINYYFVLLVLIVSYFILNRFVNSPLGKVFVAIKENEKRVKFLGYNVFLYKLIAFVISGTFAALSGGLYAITLRYASADFFSFHWSILPVVWCLIGGIGTLFGPWIGVAIMYIFQYYISSIWHYYLIIFGIIILLILRISKKGIFGYIIGRLQT